MKFYKLVYREWLCLMQSWKIFLQSLLDPLLTLSVFAFAFSRIVKSSVGGNNYIQFIIPGILGLISMSNGLYISVPIYTDKLTGELELLFSFPVGRLSIIFAKYIVAIVRSTIGFLIVVAMVCMFYSSYITMTLGSIAALYCIHCLGTLLFSSLFFMLVASIKKQDTFNLIINLIYVPLIYISKIYYPIDSMPLVFRPFALVNPMSYLVEVSRDIVSHLPVHYASLGIVSVVFVVSVLVGWRAFNRMFK